MAGAPELLSLGREAAKNDADLLIVVIPSWNEIMEVGAEDRPELQRELINEVAAELDNVYVLDLSEEIRGLGARRVYGAGRQAFQFLWSLHDCQIDLPMDAARLAEWSGDDAAGAAVRRRFLGQSPGLTVAWWRITETGCCSRHLARRRRRPARTKEHLAPPRSACRCVVVPCRRRACWPSARPVARRTRARGAATQRSNRAQAPAIKALSSSEVVIGR